MNQLESLKAKLKTFGKNYAALKTLPPEERKSFGEKLNAEKKELLDKIAALENEQFAAAEPLDPTAPTAPNEKIPEIKRGTKHPLTTELDKVVEIYHNMGFDVMESYQLDDEFHMFESLNFPEGHPARDGYDTFRTKEGFIPPAHTSTMQYRALKKYKNNLNLETEEGKRSGGQIAVVIPGRVFRNEDVDATHEHTFYQCEGIFVSETASLSQMLGVLKNFFEVYYGQKLNVRTQPGYFPFTEPSVEFLIEKPKSLGGKGDGWLEMLGCGMIHPNVLKTAGIDPEKYRGFAWGGGIDRLVMLKYGLTDVRNFESAKLDFLKEF